MRTAFLVCLLLLAVGAAYWWSSEPPAAPRATAAALPSAGEPLPRFASVEASGASLAVTATGAPGATLAVVSRGALLAEGVAGAEGSVVLDVRADLTAPALLFLRQTTDADGDPLTAEEALAVFSAEDHSDRGIVVLLTVPGGASRLLSGSPDADGSEPIATLATLAIETVDHDAIGNVIIAGRAGPGAAVQLLLDGLPLGAPTAADEVGRWEMPTELPPGAYTIRAVQVSPVGMPDLIVEVPFERPATGPDAGGPDADGTPAGVTVSRGAGPWRVSWPVHGEGRQHTTVYRATAEQARDPAAVYPDQVFRTPN